jgi:hypothetical protein
MIDSIIEKYPDESFLKADGFDEALIGVDLNSMRLVYSVSKCIEILRREMDYLDAIEYFDFNVSGAYVGKKTLFGLMTLESDGFITIFIVIFYN